MKNAVSQFAFFGGPQLFMEPKPTSDLHRPNEDRFFSYADSIFETRQFTNNGPLVQLLEKRLAEQHGTEHCVCFCSGFLTLLMCIHALALPGKTEVILPSATYRRMADIVRWAGLTPRFTDIDFETMGVNRALFETQITDKTALLLGVHPIVNMSAVTELEELSRDTGIPLLMDSVEAAYGTIHGKKIGSFAKAEVFSMHASKFINAFEGGYATTNDAELAARLRVIRAFGFEQKDSISELGCNAKLNELHAAMALSCIDELDEQVAHNKAIFNCYKKLLSDLPLSLVSYDATEKRTWKNIVVRLTGDWGLTRDEILSVLQAENILARAYYTPPLHKKFPETASLEFPVTEAVTSVGCVLPSGAHVSEEDVANVSSILHDIYAMRAQLKEEMRDERHR
ncbi:DegT/DnrJ/EryC1/StrS family aminotransferase [Desulfobaculum bizertense]|uniref:dTDP-4-amino-4,6-dideoxygalactose transaminase n=1 Tax=Desulfobaculum bizertense DSM 18034 TaxID=1121442 RepID=A0A1T4VZ15_9BACT|nr:aminotransferase class I/II-fold pyridoxal phosphate-dependent enzyme [Desulfobaculum bizertense]SKA70260.1 dTDP-4-amino-4,6-dideoxygalactose transaminase [Desulfobaculum bizertense DSM 18034]